VPLPTAAQEEVVPYEVNWDVYGGVAPGGRARARTMRVEVLNPAVARDVWPEVLKAVVTRVEDTVVAVELPPKNFMMRLCVDAGFTPGTKAADGTHSHVGPAVIF
jgi:hypothetical protein